MGDLDTIELNDPLDMHLHLRDGKMLRDVTPLSAETFCGAVIMPNLEPPVRTLEQVVEYKSQINEAKGDRTFEPYMTVYFDPTFTPKFMEEIRPYIIGPKFYSKGMTTNSHHGTDPEDHRVLDVLGAMESLGIPVLVHGEYRGFVMDRERLFAKLCYAGWAKRFPKLKIVMEHITTAECAELLLEYENIFATITPQHLAFTLDELLGDNLNPHLFCKPVLKTPEDRAVLRQVVFGHDPKWEPARKKVCLGTDSAPHDITKKLECGCAGVFSAPIALQFLAAGFVGPRVDLFDRHWSGTNRFQQFVSDNAKAIYGVVPPPKKVVLKRQEFTVPNMYGGLVNRIVPMWAGLKLDWTVESVA